MSEKQAEAEQVLAQIEALDMEVGAAVEEYNGARIQLEEIHERQESNKRQLEIAKKSLGKAQSTLADRIHMLYTSGDASTLEILLGSTSIDDFLARVDATSRVSEQDARIVSEIRAVRAEGNRWEVYRPDTLLAASNNGKHWLLYRTGQVILRTYED